VLKETTMKRTVLIAVGVVVLTGSLVRAHHSYADFDQDQTVSVEGTLERLLYINPHTILTLRTKDSTVYTAEWNAAFQLERMGVDSAALKVGDVIVVTGSPSRDATARLVSRLREVKRLSDGWNWSRAANGRVTTQKSGAQ
jgi:hypothetical protein